MFVNPLRVYATKDRVNEYNNYHLDRLGRPVIQVMAMSVGAGAAAAPDDKPVGLCNGARDPSCVIMMEFDKYIGPVSPTTADGRKVVPILLVERTFSWANTLHSYAVCPDRMLRHLCYAITVHKSQSITEDMIVTDLSCRDF
ncbi:ATP-dependent DNA helicase PIF1 [Hirsutella rhossiliensis]|uniref:ATP-dependent DNA helicase PIF1 n=1 Tax=Hirsutella rhossiliensis TaxID=111463 RepID=A0A9P8MKY8_9HYPO|nr:ATP-dependent DNA helicase PIF1 [Hirsutella rhossiliensis]KAH0957068.1 ATP-dependent DNA helicase PIF1 [Hirsutella rhossiliensis]